jgi:hypothetical protein
MLFAVVALLSCVLSRVPTTVATGGGRYLDYLAYHNDCAIKIAKRLAKITIPEDVKALLKKAREIYPDFPVYSREDDSRLVKYLRAVERQEGCKILDECIDRIYKDFPSCPGLDRLRGKLVDSPNPRAKEFVAAEQACWMSRS